MLRIDANIALRYLLDDHPELSLRATQIIDSEVVVLSMEVLCEIVYVLSGVYEVPRKEIRDTLQRFSRLPTVIVLEHQTALHALETFAQKKIDFVDAVLLAHHVLAGDQIKTFDKRLNTLLQNTTQ